MRRVPVRALYHVTPLHYVPHLLATGVLLSQAELKRQCLPIVPRKTVARRDRKLGLDDFVHLSPTPVTPLLRDKFRRGFPHALITFSPETLQLSAAALLRYNPKAFRHREDFRPITDPEEKSEVWADWERGAYPSLEIVIGKELPLVPLARSLSLAEEWQEEWLRGFCRRRHLVLPVPIGGEAISWPPMSACDRTVYRGYDEACEAAGLLLPPPLLTFD
ncbi:MAG: hypothetical protein SFU56_14285 [Capsulimonadales bacterium]|nr:hypothetical protein [Capsulimonadales bacterium]